MPEVVRTSEGSVWHGWRTDTLWQVAERATRTGLGFLLSVVIARVLGPSDFGLYSYALATVAIFAFLGQAGIDALLLRELVRAPERAPHTIGEGLALRLAGALLAGLASVAATIVAASVEERQATPLVAVLALSGVMQAGWVVESWLQANRRFGAAARAKIAAYVIAAACRLLALRSPEPLFALAIVSVLEATLCTLLLWRAFARSGPAGRALLHAPTNEGLLRLWRIAAPMLLSAFTIAIYSRIDVFMLGRMVDTAAAGLYTAGTLLSEGFYIVPTAVMAAVAPRLAQLFVHDGAGFDEHFYRFLRRLSLAGLGVALATTLVAPTIVPLLFGASYVAAAAILQIHVWSTWFVFVSSASDPWYINHDLRGFYLAKTTVAAVLNIGLNLVLIPRFHGAGAALATLVAYGASAVLLGAVSPRTRPLFFLQLRAMAGLPHRARSPTDSPPGTAP
jgi:PST family polysaccharide transporter